MGSSLRNKRIFLILALMICTPYVVFAEYDKYPPNFAVTIGEFVYNDDFTPTTDDCTLTVSNPSGSVVLNAVTMNDQADGWHYYTFAPSAIEGTWPAFISCGSSGAGTLIKQDKTFIVTSSLSTTSIATAVWNTATSSANNAGTFGAHINSTLNAPVAAVNTSITSQISSLPSDIWSYGGRTLSSFGTLVADIWSYGSRSLTTMGTLVADIWSNATRTLTGSSLSSGSLATLSDIQTASSSVTSQVNSNTNSQVGSLSGTIATASSSIASVVNGNTNTVVGTASSSLAAAITVGTVAVNSNTNTAISNASTSIVSQLASSLLSVPANVWSYGSRSLTTFGTLVADVWSSATRTLTGANLSTGSLATLSDIQSASTSVTSQINSNTNSQVGTVTTAVANASSSIASVVNGNTNTAVNSASSSLAAAITSGTASVNSNTNTAVSNASTSIGSMILSIPANVWSYSARTLTSFGSLAADVWNISTSTLTTPGSIGKQIVSNLDVVLSTISGGSALTAADVWNYAARTLTGANLNTGSLATLSDIQSASSSVTTQVNTNTNSQTGTLSASLSAASSSIAAVVNGNINTQTAAIASTINSNTNTAISNASTSIVSQLASSLLSVPANVWSYGSRSLTTFGTLVADVWSSATRTLTGTGITGGNLSSQSDIQGASWSMTMSDFDTTSAGSNYLATVYISNNGSLADPLSVPQITLYDANRNVVANGVSMTRVSAGIYRYSYTTASNAAAGVWEGAVTVTPESGKTLSATDYWNLSTSPTQVIITGIQSLIVPNITADVRITNEGTASYEYQYEWCVVSNQNNACGGGDDVYYGSAAKLINPGENFDTTLAATVPSPGTYYFKVVVYYGSLSSRASTQFTAVSNTPVTPPSSGGGGGGGGGPAAVITAPPPLTNIVKSLTADLNLDNKVNSVDFSILLAYWKKKGPFKNVRVDINNDGRVDGADFSILLSQWGKHI